MSLSFNIEMPHSDIEEMYREVGYGLTCKAISQMRDIDTFIVEKIIAKCGMVEVGDVISIDDHINVVVV